MSYGIKITKDETGLRIDELGTSDLAYIPNGTFSINGHSPKPGESPVASLALTYTRADGQHGEACSSNHNITPN